MAIRKKESTGEVQSKIKFLQVVHFAKTSELVDDDFLDRLEREGLSPSINEELVSVFLQVDEEQSGWFNRFASLLKKHPKYRSSSVQLQDVDEEKESTKLKLVPDKDETTVHVPPGPCSNAPQDHARMNESGVDQEPKLKADKSKDSEQRVDKTLGGLCEVQLVHEVLRRNRGYLEMTIPMDVIITTLEAQDVLLPYELCQVKSHASLIEKNRSFLGSLMRKSPDMFYTFCSIMEDRPGYEYIGRYLRAEMKYVDPTVPFDEKRQTIPKAVDALVDKELLEKSIQSIADKQREMAEEVRKVHQTEVSLLNKAVSDARDRVSDVKEECNKMLKQMDEEKSGSSEQLITFRERIADIFKVCENVQIQQKKDDRSTQENIIAAMKFQSRIGELTTLLEEKEQETAAWKGSAERLAKSKVRYDGQREEYEKMMENKKKEVEDLENKCDTLYSELEGQKSLVVDTLTQRDQELAESKVRYDRQREKYEKMMENMRKEIEDLENKLAESKVRYDSQREKYENMRKEMEDIKPAFVLPESEESKKLQKGSYLNPPQWDKDRVENGLQRRGINGIFMISRIDPSKDDLTLSVWNDGKCFHLEVYRLRYKDDISKPLKVAYSLVKHSTFYFESLYDLCKQYESELLPGCGFRLTRIL